MNKMIIIWISLFMFNLSWGQEEKSEIQDSLFFKLDKNLLIQNDFDNEYFYLKRNLTSTFAFLVIKRELENASTTQKCKSFKKFLKQKYGGGKIHSDELSSELRKFKIFLCDCNNNQKKIIEVYPVTIEE